jgi:hypothetical protein
MKLLKTTKNIKSRRTRRTRKLKGGAASNCNNIPLSLEFSVKSSRELQESMGFLTFDNVVGSKVIDQSGANGDISLLTHEKIIDAEKCTANKVVKSSSNLQIYTILKTLSA